MIPDYVQELQDDLYGLLIHDPGFKHVPVFRSRSPLQKGPDGEPMVGQSTMIEDEINQALGGSNMKNGKTGIVAIVMLPDVRPLSMESPGPQLEMIAVIRVMENRLFNEGSTGTGISSSRLGLHISQLLHRRPIQGAWTFKPDGDKMLQEQTLPDDVMVHEVRFVMSRSVEQLEKVSTPVITVAGNDLTITCATDGALIYYSLDGSWPGQHNANSFLYDGTVNLSTTEDVTTIRAVAYDPDEVMQPSNDELWEVE